MMTSNNTLQRFFVLACLLLCLNIAVNAQTTGTISGTVQDETGGVLPGVEVTAINTGTSASRTVVSDDQGRYRIVQLNPGSYEMRVELAGFQTGVLQDISLGMAQEAVVGVTLKVGEISEQVVVSAQVSLVETTSGTVSSLVEARQVRDLPLNGRDFIQLATLQEGVVTPLAARRTVNGDRGVKISIAGARPMDNAILLDGTDIKNQYGTTPGSVTGVLLGVDTIQEFRVITSAYSAEYGRFTGGVVSAVTRSGSNELHGSLFHFHRNSAFDARNFFDRDFSNPTVRSDPPPFKRNQFGFTLGGPIAQDRSFYFTSYEGLRERLTTTGISNFPNALAHEGIIPNYRFRGRFICGAPRGVRGKPSPKMCNVGVSDAMRPYVDIMPIPNGPDNGDGTGKVYFNNPQPTNEHYFVTKFDHKLGDNDDIFVRYTIDDGHMSFVQEGTTVKFDEINRNQYVTVEEKHIFSPSLLNEFRMAFNRNGSRTMEIDIIGVPESMYFVNAARQKASGFATGMGLLFCRGCGINQFGTSTRTPQKHIHNVYQLMDQVNWTEGNHSIKAGISFSRFQYNFANIARMQGSYQYNDLKGLITGDFINASAFCGDTNGNIMPLGYRQSLVGLYLQDDYSVTPNITLNLGLRYEFITVPSEVAGRTGNLLNAPHGEINTGDPMFDNPSLKNFSPRIGFAWDPSGEGKFSIRGGAGLFHQQILSWCCTSAFFRSTPFAIRAEFDDDRPGDKDILKLFPRSLDHLSPTAGAVTEPPLFVISQPEQPYLLQWSLTLQRELMGSMAATASYSGSRGVHIPRVADVNRPAAVRGADGLWRYNCDSTRRGTVCAQSAANRRVNTNFGSITNRTWDGTSDYHGLRLGLRKRFSLGHMFQLSYNWQKSMDEGSSIAGSPRESFNDAWLSPNHLDRHSDRGLSSYNIVHGFSANWAVELPFGPGRLFASDSEGIFGKLIEGWQLNGIVQMTSGPPLNIEGNPARSCSVCNNILGNIKDGEQFPKNAEDPNGWFISGAKMKTITDEEFPFTQPTPGRLGNLARNAGEGPGIINVDFSVLKNVSVGEDAEVQFRAEFFNVLNRTNFQGPVRARSTHSRGGTITRTFGELVQTATTNRQIQFAVKILF